MSQIEMSVEVNAPVAKVWQAFTDGPAQVDAVVDGEFSY
jgi:uncharacterized protein YndB with AHSA1/START domain